MASAISLDTARSQLAAYLAAETAALTNQSYTIGDRTLTRADLAQIQAGIKMWESTIARMENPGIRQIRVIHE